MMDCKIHTPGHVNNVSGGINATDKRYLKGGFELLGKLSSKDISNIVILPSASKDVSIKFSEK